MSNGERRVETCDAPTDEGCKWANDAADRAVAKTFAILGVDITKPESVEDFREDLRFGKHMRKLTNRGLNTAIVILVGGVMTALWLGIKQKIGTP